MDKKQFANDMKRIRNRARIEKQRKLKKLYMEPKINSYILDIWPTFFDNSILFRRGNLQSILKMRFDIDTPYLITGYADMVRIFNNTTEELGFGTGSKINKYMYDIKYESDDKSESEYHCLQKSINVFPAERSE